MYLKKNNRITERYESTIPLTELSKTVRNLDCAAPAACDYSIKNLNVPNNTFMSPYTYSSANKVPAYERDDWVSFSDWASSFSCRYHGSETNSASYRKRTVGLLKIKQAVNYTDTCLQILTLLYEYLSVLDLYAFTSRCLDLSIQQHVSIRTKGCRSLLHFKHTGHVY
jgi:hypothetical protein